MPPPPPPALPPQSFPPSYEVPEAPVPVQARNDPVNDDLDELPRRRFACTTAFIRRLPIFS